MDNVKILFDRACNVDSLEIKADFLSMENICSIVPRRLKNLTVPVKVYEDMEILLKQLNHLSTVTFNCYDNKDPSNLFAQIIKWLIQENKIFTHKEDNNTLKLSFEPHDTLH